MRKIVSMFMLLMLYSSIALAQSRTITGKVSDKNGAPVSGASIQIKGTNTGTAADNDGSFSITAKTGDVLVISALNFTTQEFTIGTESTLPVMLESSTGVVDEVVVTALGIKRSKNSLPYSAQKVGGDEVSRTRNANFASNLSGKVAGLEIRQTNTMGGSTNIVLRGNKSLTGTNQALFVVDGVPFDNANTNTANQTTGRGGYDYGNSAADMNPDDIESITVLKGAAASALYGSRGSNGVILITTKKSARGLGITVNSGVNFGSIDKSTFAKYQSSYGGGYGQYYEDASGFYLYRDVNGDGVDDLVVPTSEDASYGGKFDPNLMVYQWDAFDESSPFFGKPKPWVAAPNNPASYYFQKPVSFNNSVFIDGGSDKGTFKLGYTRSDEKGILPNSKITKDLVNFAGTYNITERLTASAGVSFTKLGGLGRYGTGYDSKNPATNFRQWWQVNVDLKEQREAYFRTRKNVTWNWADPTNLAPIYWDNPYWTRYENYENDSRSRYFGNASLNYKVTDWLNILGRVSVDSYDELQEERIAIGSIDVSEYSRFNRSYRETNFDLMANFDKNLSKDFNLKALAGMNIRKNRVESIAAETNGGLVVPGIYSLSNSANPINAPVEFDGRREVDGYFGGATLSYKDMLILDGTFRRDISSTLPEGNNKYNYPSLSFGFVFSKLLPSATWLTYGKLRANYAEVGGDAPYYSVYDVYTIGSPFSGNPLASVAGTKANNNLKPERTKSSEIGMEVSLFKGRFGFDITYYNAKTQDQILPVTVSTATGYNSKFVNSGTIVNKGIELSVNANPVKTKDFSWNLTVNWTRNRNKVTQLFEDAQNLVLGTFQGGVSLNATLNQPYGTIRGSNFVYHANGQKIVQANGRYQISQTANEVIGNSNPDWIGGVSNSFKYKDFSLSFLVDVRKGGDVFSLDLYYGLATGLYPETAGLNDLGNPLRNTIADGGGIIRDGVTEDGKPNTTRVSATNYGAYGYRYSPAAGFVYDASYVKLREVALTYSLPKSVVNKLAPFKGIDFSVVGRNLWIIHKNLPYADPEETISSGNLQGYSGGAYPTTRNIGVNVKLRF